MKNKKGATALPVSHGPSKLRVSPDLSLNEEKEGNCLLSSGSGVRIPPGTPFPSLILKKQVKSPENGKKTRCLESNGHWRIKITATIQRELDHIAKQRSRASQIDSLFQGYRICARTEGKSEDTIRIAKTLLKALKRFLEYKNFPDDVLEIGVNEFRKFILYLQEVRA